MYNSPAILKNLVMIHTKCPICYRTVDPTQEKLLFLLRDEYAHTYAIVKCTHCQNILTWFDKDININLYYDELDYTLQDTRNTLFHSIQKIEYNRVLRLLKKMTEGDQKTLLDFGCGKGIFLSFAIEMGFRVKGVETSLPRASYAEKYFHIEVNKSYYISGQVFPEKFDILTLFHVVEHLTDPIPLLKNLVRHNLNTNGILVIEAPNFTSWQSKWAGKRWMQLDVPRHLTHFTPAVLRKGVESAGCCIIHQQFFSFHLGIMGMAQTLMSWLGYKGFLMRDLKHNRKWKIMLPLLLVIPVATLLELTAAVAGKGGIIRYYAVKKNDFS